MNAITTDEATAVAEALGMAAASCPVRQLRAELDARSSEWARAVQWVEEIEGADVLPDGDGIVIEMLSNVCRGMQLPHDRHGWVRVMRVMPGGLGLHLEADGDERPLYRNFMHATSPVVVRA